MSSSAGFPTTAWEECIKIVQDPAHENHILTVNDFINTYWKPVFYFLRTRGYPLQQAEDLTQDFFLKFLEKNWIQKADRERGRFRNFLLKILARFLSDQGPGRAPRQKQFERQFVSIQTLVGDEERAFEPPTDVTPDAIFMKKWARALLERVHDQLREHYRAEKEDRRIWYEVFTTAQNLDPSGKSPSQEALAAQFHLTRDQVRYALDQVEKRFRRLLRAEVREQVASEEEIDEEITDLLRLVK